MLPRGDALLRGAVFFTRRRGLSGHFDVAVFDEAVREAAQLAADREEDEPAALFYACARRSRAFGRAAHDIVPQIARNQARATGRVLAADDLRLDVLRTRVLLGAITWDELRADFAARLRPRAS